VRTRPRRLGITGRLAYDYWEDANAGHKTAPASVARLAGQGQAAAI
jgi:hypothetical protein